MKANVSRTVGSTLTRAQIVSRLQALEAVKEYRKVMEFRDEGYQTYDREFIDAAGVFLVGELERLDQTLHLPLYDYTWGRDMPIRSDVGMGDELSSFTNSTFAAAGSMGSGKSWVGKDTNVIRGMALDITKTATPLYLWAMELSWTLTELAAAAQAGRPVDSQKFSGMMIKYNMDVDEQAYIGDTALNFKGLLNLAGVTNVTNVAGGSWAALITANAVTAPDLILKDINELLYSVWAASAFAEEALPAALRLPPLQYGLLATTKVSSAGNLSILQYVLQNNIVSARGRKLSIEPLKWCIGTTNNGFGPGSGGADSMLAYTPIERYVRLPIVPLQRTPLENRSIFQLTTYYGRLGGVECPYPETIGRRDGL